MAIDKTMLPVEGQLPDPSAVVDVPLEDVDAAVYEEDGAVVMETGDGGVEVDFDPYSTPPAPDTDHYANLAEFMDPGEMGRLSTDLVSLYNHDKDSRREWEETYTKGLELLGLNIEDRTEPFRGACGITHPLISEAVVRFQSQTIGELFPASGPTKSRIVGEASPEKIAQGNRVADFMNYLLLDEIEEYREEVDRMLFALPLAGSAFKKIYFDPDLGRPASMFVEAENLIVAYGTSSLDVCGRMTHLMRKPENWVRKRQDVGFYRDIDLHGTSVDPDRVVEKKDEIVGIQKNEVSNDLRTLLEMHVTTNLVGFDSDEALPYVITIDQTTNQVLSIYRNWKRDDQSLKRRDHFIHYQYIPGLGFYGLGLIHLIGGIAAGATSILRQLVDSGSFANLPGGFRTRNVRIKGDSTPIAPGEWRDVDVTTGKISDGLFPLPYKEPSPVLHALLGDIVEEGRRFASLTDINVSNMNQEAPVGTTLALLERNLKVMTAIAARCHNSMKRELKILSVIVKENYQQYPYEVSGDVSLASDFDDRIDIIPVSDPNSSTMAQRIMQYQAALQMSQMYPQGYRHEKLHRQMLNVLAIQDAHEIVPTEDDLLPLDPVSENQRILNLDPVKAFAYQDHQAHIQVHMMGMQDPKIQTVLQDSPMAQQAMAGMMAHVTDHIAHEYRKQIEANLGAPLPPEDQPLPPEIEVELSRMTAQAADKLFRRNQTDVAQAEADALASDPVYTMNRRELEMKEAKTLSDMENQKLRLELEIAKMHNKMAIDTQRLNQQAESDAERVQGDMLGNLLRAASATEELKTEEKLKLVDMLIERVKQEGENARAERMARTENDKMDAEFFSRLLAGERLAEPPSEGREEVGTQNPSNTGE